MAFKAVPRPTTFRQHRVGIADPSERFEQRSVVLVSQGDLFDRPPRVRHSDHRASISEICGIAGFRLAITAQLAPHTRFIVPFLGWLRFSDACMDNHIILVYLAPSTNIPESRFGTWDSELEGSIHKWNMSAGDVISQRKAADRPAVLILEPCTHNIQIGGLCAICGKDMTMCVTAVL